MKAKRMLSILLALLLCVSLLPAAVLANEEAVEEEPAIVEAAEELAEAPAAEETVEIEEIVEEPAEATAEESVEIEELVEEPAEAPVEEPAADASRETYTITYNANGGSGAPAAQTCIAGQEVSLSEKKPTRTGYVFKGWATSSTAVSPQYYGGYEYGIEDNMTLYALWAKQGTPVLTGITLDSTTAAVPSVLGVTISTTNDANVAAVIVRFDSDDANTTIYDQDGEKNGWILSVYMYDTTRGAFYVDGSGDICGTYTISYVDIQDYEGNIVRYAISDEYANKGAGPNGEKAWADADMPAALSGLSFKVVQSTKREIKVNSADQSLSRSYAIYEGANKESFGMLRLNSDGTAVSDFHESFDGSTCTYAYYDIGVVAFTYKDGYYISEDEFESEDVTTVYMLDETSGKAYWEKTGEVAYTLSTDSSTGLSLVFTETGYGEYYYVDNTTCTPYSGGVFYYLGNQTVLLQNGLGDGIAYTLEKVNYPNEMTATPASGWKDFSDGRRYFDANGKMQTGTATINGTTYVFDANGIVQNSATPSPAPTATPVPVTPTPSPAPTATPVPATPTSSPAPATTPVPATPTPSQTITHSGTGWEKDTTTGSWYYFKNSVMVKSSWVKSGSSWYYMGADGAMLTGLQTISGTKYYFTSNGVMKTGWVSIDGSWYYFNTSGAMATGWKQISSTWYYFGSDGKMYASQWCGNYYMKSNGAMATGWLQIDGSWYYFGTSGAMQTGWKQISSTWYYFGTDGKMYNAQWNGNYYLKSGGAMAKGWCQIGSDWYYFASSGAAQTGWMKSGSTWYYFGSDGKMYANQWLQIGSTLYYFDASGANTAEKAAPEEGDTGYVWIPQDGTKYHRTSTCSGMDNPTKVTQAQAEALGYEPCGKCW